jgi:hypothetical protein
MKDKMTWENCSFYFLRNGVLFFEECYLSIWIQTKWIQNLCTEFYHCKSFIATKIQGEKSTNDDLPSHLFVKKTITETKIPE